jgi:hypothetical protein
MAKKSSKTEMHPLFPSGDWEGFYNYTYDRASSKSKMEFSLNFKKGKISGNGSDDVGSFSWSGTYDINGLTAQITKQYHDRHSVVYHGNVDENGIWGHWLMYGYKGGFHIWPKKNEEKAAEEEVMKEKKVAKKKKNLKLTHS